MAGALHSFQPVLVSRPVPRSRRPRAQQRLQCVAASTTTVLTADVGGTNARYEVHSINSAGAPVLAFEKTYQTADHPTFEGSLAALLQDAAVSRVDAACIAVAGPVSNNACKLTNVAWSIDGQALSSQLGTRAIQVINDFEAVGYGIVDLPASEVLTLHNAPPVPRAPMVVLGPGTGLGQALLTWDAGAGHYIVHPTEGAHADFAPVGELQRRLAAHVEEKLGECEVEMVCCGAGIVRIYDFMRSELKQESACPAGLTPAEVTARALEGSCPVASGALHLFLSILGAEAANLGLKALARGGVYIAGGIPGKVMPLLKSTQHLQQGFLKPSCRFAGVRASMPLHVVRLPDPGLRGALLAAMRSLR